MTRPFTAAGDPGAERHVTEALAALVSTLREAAGDPWRGAFLGGALGHGEGATEEGPGGAPACASAFELFAVLDVGTGHAAGAERSLARALARTARSRRVAATVSVLSSGALRALPASRDLLEALAARRVVDGEPSLLAGAHVAGAERPASAEALRLLVRRGAALLLAERGLSGGGSALAARRAFAAAADADLASGEVLLLFAGRWVPGEAARAEALRALGSSGEATATGLHARMTWTRFRDVVEAQRSALSRRAAGIPPDDLVLAQVETARATDRFLEVLRLSEEERLGTSLPDWTAHARALLSRHPGSSLPLFGEDVAPDADDGLAGLRASRRWPPAERLAPALAAQLDWDPGDLALVPILLGVPPDTSRDRLAHRTALLAADV